MAITLTSEQPLISYTCLFKSSALHDHDLSLLVCVHTQMFLFLGLQAQNPLRTWPTINHRDPNGF